MEVLEALVCLNVFFATIYVPYFLRASVGTDAAFNDLNLFKSVYDYMEVDGPMAVETREVLSRHGWYTTQQTVVYSLFSIRLTNNEKSRMAARILTFSSPEEYPLGKPEFQELTRKTELSDLIGPNSYMLFTILGTDYYWLQLSPDKWGDIDDYKEMEEYVRTVKVVNDAAERGIKLISDYSQILTKDNVTRVKLLQGVEMSRKINPDFNKSTLNNNTRWN